MSSWDENGLMKLRRARGMTIDFNGNDLTHRWSHATTMISYADKGLNRRGSSPATTDGLLMRRRAHEATKLSCSDKGAMLGRQDDAIARTRMMGSGGNDRGGDRGPCRGQDWTSALSHAAQATAASLRRPCPAVAEFQSHQQDATVPTRHLRHDQLLRPRVADSV